LKTKANPVAQLSLVLLLLAGVYVVTRYRAPHQAEVQPVRLGPNQARVNVLASDECNTFKLDLGETHIDTDNGQITMGVNVDTNDPQFKTLFERPQDLPVHDPVLAMNKRLTVTAQCIDAAGRAIGSPLPLKSLNPYASTTFNVPGSYPTQAAAIRIDMAETANPSVKSTWTVACRAKPTTPDNRPVVDKFTAGDVHLDACAVRLDHLDGHGPIGIQHSVIRQMQLPDLEKRMFQGMSTDSNSVVAILRMRTPTVPTPGSQWIFSPSASNLGSASNLTSAQPLFAEPPSGFGKVDQTLVWAVNCGAGYTGLNHRVEIKGDLTRSDLVVDTVTLKDAYLDYDPETQSYNFAWRSRQSGTSKMGRKVVVLNVRHPLRPQMSTFGSNQAVLLIAVKLPGADFDHNYSMQPPSLSSPELNGLMTGASPFTFTPPDWGNVRLVSANAPATADLKAQRKFYDNQLSSLRHEQYQVVLTAVQLNLNPKQAKSIHLKTVTLSFYDQKVAVRDHVALNLPIRTDLRPGWLPITDCWVDGPAPPSGTSNTIHATNGGSPPPGATSVKVGGGGYPGSPGGFLGAATPQPPSTRGVPGSSPTGQ